MPIQTYKRASKNNVSSRLSTERFSRSNRNIVESGYTKPTNTKLRYEWSGYRLLLPRECSSHVTTYSRMSARTFENMLCRGSNIRAESKRQYPDHSQRSLVLYDRLVHDSFIILPIALPNWTYRRASKKCLFLLHLEIVDFLRSPGDFSRFCSFFSRNNLQCKHWVICWLEA